MLLSRQLLSPAGPLLKSNNRIPQLFASVLLKFSDGTTIEKEMCAAEKLRASRTLRTESEPPTLKEKDGLLRTVLKNLTQHGGLN